MRIFHLSDTHVGSASDFNKGTLYRLLEAINESGSDLVIHSGDVTQGGRRTEYKRARQMLSRIEAPAVILPGNHDARSGGLHLFEEYIGDTSGVREIGDTAVIWVNSAFADSDQGRVGMVKYNMMRRALNEHSDTSIKIIALHHHVVPIPRAGRERNVLYNAGDILDLILSSDVDLVLSGHRHYPNIYRIENTVFINAGAASATKTRYGDVNSYNLVDIDAERQHVATRWVDGSQREQTFSRRRRHVFSDFGRRVFRAVQVSNSYISDGRAFLPQHFRNAVDAISGLQPDLLVHCGGIVREGIPQDYDIAARELSRFNVPVIYTPAGRDINYLGYHLYATHFGQFDQAYSDGAILFQGISSAQYDSHEGIVGPTERRAVLDQLAAAPEHIKAVFLHHNVLPIPHSREKGLLEDAGDLLRELVDANVDLILTGTSSHPFAARVGNTVVINANSLSSVYQRSLYGNSFNLIDIYEGAIAVFEINSLWGRRRLLGIWERNSQSSD
jgi:putative phosphoesterase